MPITVANRLVVWFGPKKTDKISNNSLTPTNMPMSSRRLFEFGERKYQSVGVIRALRRFEKRVNFSKNLRKLSIF